MTGSKRS